MRALIVGQGIAGTVLAWTLLKKGVQVQIADAGFPHSSSSIAAGIINPVTGKRLVKSWRLDDFYAHAKPAYQNMERDWDCRVWHEQDILRLLDSPQEINDWAARLSQPEYANILLESPNAGQWSGILAPGFSFGKIKNSARVDFPLLLETFRKYAIAQQIFLQQQIQPAEALEMAADFDFIVFCEGHHALKNPFFPNLPWQLSKGEALLLQLAHPNAAAIQDMAKKTLALVPIGGGRFWAGASYAWNFEDGGATETAQNSLEKHLEKMLQAPYKIIQRMGAIRPTVKDRRPFLGASPEHSKIFIFNGLGTKGALLAPYWASHLAAHILDGKQLDADVDIRRYS